MNELFKQADQIKNENRDHGKKHDTNINKAVEYFYNVILNDFLDPRKNMTVSINDQDQTMPRKVFNASRNGRSSCVLYTLDLNNLSEERDLFEINNHVYTANNLWWYKKRPGHLQKMIKDHFFLRESDGKIVRDPSTGHPISTANIFMRRTRKTDEDGNQLKIYNFIMDWSRQCPKKPDLNRQDAFRKTGEEEDDSEYSYGSKSSSDEGHVKQAVEKIENGQLSWADISSDVSADVGESWVSEEE